MKTKKEIRKFLEEGGITKGINKLVNWIGNNDYIHQEISKLIEETENTNAPKSLIANEILRSYGHEKGTIKV